MPRPGSWWRITPCGLPIANTHLLHSKGRVELLHGEKFGIKVRAYPGAQALMIIVVRIAGSISSS